MLGKSNVKLEVVARRTQEHIHAQAPDTVIITCSDSRVIPEYIFDKELGELFVIRIAGNVITSEVLASVEFACLVLNSSLIVVLGHQNCGAVESKLSAPDPSTLTKNLQTLLTKIKLINDEESLDANIENNAYFQKEMVLKESPAIAKLVEEQNVLVIPAIYQLETREVKFLETPE